MLKNSESIKRVPISSPVNNKSKNLSEISAKMNLGISPISKKQISVLNYNLGLKNSGFLLVNKNQMQNKNNNNEIKSSSQNKNLKNVNENNQNQFIATKKSLISSGKKLQNKKNIIQVNLGNKVSGRNVFILNSLLSPRDILSRESQTARGRSTSNKSNNSNHSSSSHFQILKNNNKIEKTNLNFGHVKHHSNVLNIQRDFAKTKSQLKIDVNKNPQKQIKVVKGIEIKNFNKAINIIEKDSQKMLISPGHRKAQSNTARSLRFFNN